MEGRAKKRVALEIDFPRDRRQSGEVENSAKEKETASAISLISGCAYTPVMVDQGDFLRLRLESVGTIIISSPLVLCVPRANPERFFTLDFATQKREIPPFFAWWTQGDSNP